LRLEKSRVQLQLSGQLNDHLMPRLLDVDGVVVKSAM